MRLLRVKVTNYRSADDTGWFDIAQVTALVGKNEAGKSAVLQALAGLNPHPTTPITFDKERDYPRRHLTSYATRHVGQEATVISTEWEMTSVQRAAITAEFGEDAISKRPRSNGDGSPVDAPVAISRRYGDPAPEWSLPVKIQAAAKTKQLLEAAFPRFMYFSHYDRMAGLVRVDELKIRVSQGVVLDPGERVFVDFLNFAGTSPDEISSAVTYESLNARCEAASNSITDQLLEFWTQNPDLEVEVRLTKGEPNDPPPFNAGIVCRARVRNNLHRVSLPFSERSAGFIWFFSFLVKFAQVSSDATPAVLLLDEPGLTLHGKAQGDLLRYFRERLAPSHQVIFSTHSPFLVPPDRLIDVRIVEDQVITTKSGRREPEGTRVRANALATDPDTLFPLQGALGYEVTQALFVGKHTLLVEGPGDILFLQAWSSALGKHGKPRLDPRWTLCPAGGIDKIQSFVSLFSGSAKLDITALTDFSRSDKRKLDALRQANLLADGRLLDFATLLTRDEADAEDVFAPELYVRIVNEAFVLPRAQHITVAQLTVALPPTTRLVKQVEACFRLLPPNAPPFDHYRPAEWLLQNPQALEGDAADVLDTLSRAEKIIVTLNALLPTEVSVPSDRLFAMQIGTSGTNS
jgi:energy-coupling factor transporter ATP-binding protein EcfA2